MSTPRRRGVRWQTVALPSEHGGWSFVGEPVLLGLLLAPSASGAALAVAAVAGFLLRHPLRIQLKALRTGRSTPRTRMARRFVLLHGAALAVAGLASILLAPSPIAFAALALAAPLLTVQLWHDALDRSRDVIAELAGVTATGAIASTVVTLDGGSLTAAAGPWLALAIKGVATVLYVRARLRSERGEAVRRALPFGAHVIGTVVLATAAAGSLLPWTAPAAMALLTIRAVAGTFGHRRRVPAKTLGAWEAAYGVLFVLLIAAGDAFS